MIKHKEKIYAEALSEAILRGKKEDIFGVLALLLRKANYKQAKLVVALSEKKLFAKSSKKKIILETARKMKVKDLFKGVLNSGDVIEERVNPDLIAGIRIIVNDEKQLDFSLRKKLEEIFI